MTDTNFDGSIPDAYDRHLGPVIFAPYAEDLARRIAAARLTAPVLEIACGTGILTRRLLAALPSAIRVVATDLNEAMVEAARTTLGRNPRVSLDQADAADLPFEAGSFGAVACQFGMMFVPDKAAAVREARRVLTPNGLFAFNVWGALADNSFARIAHETIGGFFKSDPPLFYQIPFGWHDQRVIRNILVENGFTNVHFDRLALTVESPSARDFAVGLVEGNPVSNAIREAGLPFPPIISAVEEALARAGGDRPFRAPTAAVVVTARAARE